MAILSFIIAFESARQQPSQNVTTKNYSEVRKKVLQLYFNNLCFMRYELSN